MSKIDNLLKQAYNFEKLASDLDQKYLLQNAISKYDTSNGTFQYKNIKNNLKQ